MCIVFFKDKKSTVGRKINVGGGRRNLEKGSCGSFCLVGFSFVFVFFLLFPFSTFVFFVVTFVDDF